MSVSLTESVRQWIKETEQDITYMKNTPVRELAEAANVYFASKDVKIRIFPSSVKAVLDRDFRTYESDDALLNVVRAANNLIVLCKDDVDRAHEMLTIVNSLRDRLNKEQESITGDS